MGQASPTKHSLSRCNYDLYDDLLPTLPLYYVDDIRVKIPLLRALEADPCLVEADVQA